MFFFQEKSLGGIICAKTNLTGGNARQMLAVNGTSGAGTAGPGVLEVFHVPTQGKTIQVLTEIRKRTKVQEIP